MTGPRVRRLLHLADGYRDERQDAERRIFHMPATQRNLTALDLRQRCRYPGLFIRLAAALLVGGEGQVWVGHFGGVAGSGRNPPFPPQPEVRG